MKLAVATICPHVFHEGRWWSYEPFLLEMNLWHELFEQLIVVAPLEQGPPPQFWTPYQNSAGISVIPFRRDKGRGLQQEPATLAELPRMLYALAKAAWQADAFHVRAPGSIALPAALLVPLCHRYRIAKYAGEWPDHPGEARSYRWQRRILASRWWGAPVTVYGEWPNQPPHVIPFFTSVLREDQVALARQSAQRKLAAGPSTGPLRVLYVGRLSASKNVDVLLDALAQMQAAAIPVECTIVGEGAERNALEAQTRRLGLQTIVTFAGGVDFERVLDFYERADLLVLGSSAEGWGKVLVEAMSFGLVCIGSERGVMPWMLGDGRGLVVPARDVKALAAALQRVATAPAEFLPMRAKAAAWAQGFTLEGLRALLCETLNRHWGQDFSARPALVQRGEDQ